MTSNEIDDQKVLYFPGYLYNGQLYESIRVGKFDSELVFLTYTPENGFYAVNEIKRLNDIIKPYRHPTNTHIFDDYIFENLPTRVPSTSELYERVLLEYKKFLLVDELWYHVSTAALLLSYHQCLTQVVPILHAHGQPESGKSVWMKLAKLLGYRTIYSESANEPDIRRAVTMFQPTNEGGTPCLWCEDEFSKAELNHERKKTAMKQGCYQGSMVLRVDPTTGSLIGFSEFCLKFVSGVEVLDNTEINSRKIYNHFIASDPQEDLREVLNLNPAYGKELRNDLLAWRVAQVVNRVNFHAPHSFKLKTPSSVAQQLLKRRLREIWDPLLKMSFGTIGQEHIAAAALKDYVVKAKMKYDSVDGAIAEFLRDRLHSCGQTASPCAIEVKEIRDHLKNQEMWGEGKTGDWNLSKRLQGFGGVKSERGFRRSYYDFRPETTGNICDQILVYETIMGDPVFAKLLTL